MTMFYLVLAFGLALPSTLGVLVTLYILFVKKESIAKPNAAIVYLIFVISWATICQILSS